MDEGERLENYLSPLAERDVGKCLLSLGNCTLLTYTQRNRKKVFFQF